ncbi:MAG: hypothetical protein CBARDMAM_5598 [uncultured Caballeronia sp.]|nr:MAG: hypothetical protein CBARDMAM_5598 [uncultured Caballeronia sp.]
MNNARINRKLLIGIIKNPDTQFKITPRNTLGLAQFMARLFLRRSGARQRKPNLPDAWPGFDNARDAVHPRGRFYDYRSNIQSRHWSGKIVAYASACFEYAQ